MITLDAGVLIALFNAKDAHHEAAMKLLDAATRRDDLLYMNPLSQAEVLVKAAQQGSEKIYYEKIVSIGVATLAAPTDTGVWLAQLRARTGLKLPDCAVILTAQQSGSKIATFDHRLAREARALGVTVLPAAA